MFKIRFELKFQARVFFTEVIKKYIFVINGFKTKAKKEKN